MKVVFLVLMVLTTASFGHAAESADAVKPDSYISEEKKNENAAEADKEHETLDSFFTLYQPYLTNISAYEPIFFLVGTDPAKSKFQISFKYRFLNPNGTLAQKNQWVKGLHFGYTQTSFWDLKSDSAPFEDTSYKPELFHITTNIEARPSWLQGFFFKTGALHESNGRADQLSRSFNYCYLQPIFIFYNEKSKLGMSVAPKVWANFNDGDHNKDIEDYRGYFELNTKIGKADSFVFNSDLRWAKEGGSVQLDLTYPVGSSVFNNINLYLHVQYVSALAESLLHYQERTEAVRIGVSFIR